MGTATARVLSGVYPPWMAMVSSRMSQRPRSGRRPASWRRDGSPLRHPRRARPRRLGRGRSRRGPGSRSPPRIRRWSPPGRSSRRAHAPLREDGKVIPLSDHVAADVTLVFAEQVGGPYSGWACTHHRGPVHLSGGDAPTDLLRIERDVVAGRPHGVQGDIVPSGVGESDGSPQTCGQRARRVRRLGEDTGALGGQRLTLDAVEDGQGGMGRQAGQEHRGHVLRWPR